MCVWGLVAPTRSPGNENQANSARVMTAEIQYCVPIIHLPWNLYDGFNWIEKAAGMCVYAVVCVCVCVCVCVYVCVLAGFFYNCLGGY